MRGGERLKSGEVKMRILPGSLVVHDTMDSRTSGVFVRKQPGGISSSGIAVEEGPPSKRRLQKNLIGKFQLVFF